MLLVDCIGHDGNDLAVSVFCNLQVVSRSSDELSTPIGALFGLALSR